MSSLHFCKYPENTGYTLSKQAQGLWPCGISLISSMEFPLHFPPSSASWPQPHRFFSLPLQKHSAAKIKNKSYPSKVRSSWQTQRLQPLGWCFNPAPVLQPAAALLCPHLQPWEQLQAVAGHNYWGMQDEERMQIPWCYRYLGGLEWTTAWSRYRF